MILTTGSLAYDYLMSYDGHFEDQILTEGIQNLSIAFLVNKLQKHRGGTAGNIGYNLKLLDESPLIIASAGYDFSEYKEFLHLQGINDKHITILEDEATASAFITTDKKGNQMTMFYPGAMQKAAKLDLGPLKQKITYAIIAPETKEVMLHYAAECQTNNIPYLFDPGQNVPTFSEEELMKCISGAKGFIVNEYEWQLFYGKTGISKEELTKKTEMIIITMGKKGSKIFSKKENILINSYKPREVQDPTGCGDAYRAGLLKGLKNSLSVKESGKLAALAATYCVEEHGTQNHQYTSNEFKKRLSKESK